MDQRTEQRCEELQGQKKKTDWNTLDCLKSAWMSCT